MTDAEMIEEIKMVAETDDDVLVGYYLDNAKEIVLNQLYPFDEHYTDVIPPRYEHLLTRIAVVLIAKRGAEGETMHIENGINRHYNSADVPAALLRQITPKAVPV